MFNNHHLPKSLINEAANVLGETNSDFDLPPALAEIVKEAAADYVQCPTREDRKAIIEWHIEQVMNINDVEQQTIVNFERAVEYTVNEGILDTAKGAIKGGLGAIGNNLKNTRVIGNVLGANVADAASKPVSSIAKHGMKPVSKGLKSVAGDVRRSVGQAGETAKELVANIGRLPAEAVQGAIKGAKAAQSQSETPKTSKPSPNARVLGRKGTDLINRFHRMYGTKSEQHELLDVLGSLNEEEFNAYLDILSESELELLEQILVEAGLIDSLASTGVSLYKGTKAAFNAGKKAYNKSQKNLEGRSLTIGFGPKKKPASPSKPERTSPKPQTSLHNPQTSLYNPQTENQTERKTDDDFDPNSKHANDYQAAAGRGDYNEVIRLGHLMRQGKNK